MNPIERVEYLREEIELAWCASKAEGIELCDIARKALKEVERLREALERIKEMVEKQMNPTSTGLHYVAGWKQCAAIIMDGVIAELEAAAKEGSDESDC